MALNLIFIDYSNIRCFAIDTLDKVKGGYRPSFFLQWNKQQWVMSQWIDAVYHFFSIGIAVYIGLCNETTFSVGYHWTFPNIFEFLGQIQAC